MKINIFSDQTLLELIDYQLLVYRVNRLLVIKINMIMLKYLKLENIIYQKGLMIIIMSSSMEKKLLGSTN